MLPLADPDAEFSSAFLQRELDLLDDLVVFGNRLFCFAGEGDPNGGHVNENRHGSFRKRAA
jgi:hypothetical protein